MPILNAIPRNVCESFIFLKRTCIEKGLNLNTVNIRGEVPVTKDKLCKCVGGGGNVQGCSSNGCVSRFPAG